MIICDAHTDVLSQRLGLYPEQSPCVTMENLRRGGVGLVTTALFAGAGGEEIPFYAFAEQQLAELERFRAEGLRLVDDPAEMDGTAPCTMLSIEGAEIFEGKLERIAYFRGKGVRMVAITWNRENELTYPALAGEAGGGIKPFGWEALAEMARLHMAADVSHLHPKGFWELVERHPQPILASHSDCAALCPHPRNLTDDQIRALCDRGGWMGINFYPDFLRQEGEATLEDILRHIDHVAQMGLVAHLGFGSDFDGIDQWPQGVNSPADFPAILEALRQRGYGEKALRGIAGENFLRYYQRLNAS